MHEQPNFYWNQEQLPARPAGWGKAWSWSILRAGADRRRSGRQRHECDPAARRLCRDDAATPARRGSTIPAASAAWRRRSMPTCWRAPSPGRARPATARNEIFNVTNGDVFVWPNVWPAIADALGFDAGRACAAVARQARSGRARRVGRDPRGARPDVAARSSEFVGLSFEYADYTMGYGRDRPGPPALVSTIKLMQAGFPEVMDTEVMFRKCLRRDAGEEAAAAALTACEPGRRSEDRRSGPLDAPSISWRGYLKLSVICLRLAWVLFAMSPTCALRSTHWRATGWHLEAQHRLRQLDLQVAGHGEIDDGQEAELDRPSEKKSHARMIVSQAPP